MEEQPVHNHVPMPHAWEHPPSLNIITSSALGLWIRLIREGPVGRLHIEAEQSGLENTAGDHPAQCYLTESQSYRTSLSPCATEAQEDLGISQGEKYLFNSCRIHLFISDFTPSCINLLPTWQSWYAVF